MTIAPESVGLQLRLAPGGGVEPVYWPPMQWAPGRAGLTLAYSARAEVVYRISSDLGFAELVPARVSGYWDGETHPRRFFLRHAPDAALDLRCVDVLTQYLGWVSHPSGVPATPWSAEHGHGPTWLIADTPRELQHLLRHQLALLLGEPHLV